MRVAVVQPRGVFGWRLAGESVASDFDFREKTERDLRSVASFGASEVRAGLVLVLSIAVVVLERIAND